jgi:hypothetical protein
MNKKTLSWQVCTLVVVVCAICLVGCEGEIKNVPHANPELLVGNWTHEGRGTLFTIRADLSFECEITVPESGKAKVTGRLDATDPGLGPNDYILRQMDTTGDASTYPANILIRDQVTGFSNTLVATLTISADRKKFTFVSNTPAADAFFGGEYTRVE